MPFAPAGIAQPNRQYSSSKYALQYHQKYLENMEFVSKKKKQARAQIKN